MGEKACLPCKKAGDAFRNQYQRNLELDRAYLERRRASLEVREAEKLKRKEELKEERERKRLLKRFYKVLVRKNEILQRAASIQHGTTLFEAHRCKWYFKKLCDSCLPIYKDYVREHRRKNKDKVNEKKRAYYKRVGYPKSRLQRAIKAGVKHEPYSKQTLFERDGYNCYLCGIPVDLNGSSTVGKPGWELYPHIEHVIPISKGGTDTLDNVKIAHAKCNLDKGTKVL